MHILGFRCQFSLVYVKRAYVLNRDYDARTHLRITLNVSYLLP